MCKYMKKSTTESVIASMEIPFSYSGVRTRSKTLALKKLQSHNNAAAAASPSAVDPVSEEASYHQISSCGLLNPKPLLQNHNTIAISGLCPNFSSSRCSNSKLGFEKVVKDCDAVENEVEIGDFESSFAENDLDFELGLIRASKERTPCNSSLRPLIKNAAQQVMPTASELEEFFAFEEQHQQKLFMDKYNFDVSSEIPMPGRYEWVPINP